MPSAEGGGMEIKMKNILYRVMMRNKYTLNGEKVLPKKVNLEYWNGSKNLGDCLAPVIYSWMLKNKGLSADEKMQNTIHLTTVGSILGIEKYPFDAVVWGSGIHKLECISTLTRYNYIKKMDIRAVRGPVTQYILKYCGYDCPEIYGDPAILMPLIYPHSDRCTDGKISLVRHFKSTDTYLPKDINKIDIKTTDYKYFIDEICSSKKVISSSLHGIILAESYGVPAIFFQDNMDRELLKFYDWYYSTGRKNIKIAYSLEEAIEMEAMPLPELSRMRNDLIKTFPYDIWKL